MTAEVADIENTKISTKMLNIDLYCAFLHIIIESKLLKWASDATRKHS